jgi:hypothetical protein
MDVSQRGGRSSRRKHPADRSEIGRVRAGRAERYLKKRALHDGREEALRCLQRAVLSTMQSAGWIWGQETGPGRASKCQQQADRHISHGVCAFDR